MRHVQVDFAAEARSVALARRTISDLLADAAVDEWLDSAALAVSEIVTNAVMHTGSLVSFAAWATSAGVRVEVSDASAQLPARREYAVTSGTGRGLHLLDNVVDRWGSDLRPPGKVVWFELGDHVGPADDPATRPPAPAPAAADETVMVQLHQLPLLMHWAWQEHAQALLREYLLFALDFDPDVMERHAQASDALGILYEQVPLPTLPEDPGELLADAIEPGVTADRVLVEVPRPSVAHFATLHTMLSRASKAAREGSFLGPPTHPEIAEMREWICDEVARQSAADDGAPRPWVAQTDVRTPRADEPALRERYAELSRADEAILAADESSVIVAASAQLVDFLGYESESQLLGRRVIAVIPPRFHQAHIAGTTLNATNGRKPLLDVDLTVPVVRADGSEVRVGLRVSPRRISGEHRVFVAVFDLAPPG